MRNRFALVAAIMAMPIAAAAAQNQIPRNVITIQPLTAMMTIFSGEFERSASKSVSWGVGATYWDAGDAGNAVKYSSGDFKLRYYPSGVALAGFSLGGSVGFSNVKGTSTTGADESAGGASLGVLLEYQWLMGTKRNFALALGAGAKTLMVDDKTISSSDFTAHYPTARVSVGYAF
jgi:hypothetical protein